MAVSSIPELTKEIVHHLGDMFRNELRLARTEAVDSARTMGGSLVKLGAGIAFAMAAITLGGMAVVEALPPEVPRWAAFLMAALAAGVAGLIYFQMAKASLAPKSLTLPKTREQVGRDIQAIKEHLPS
jgi:hypothetical protein